MKNLSRKTVSEKAAVGDIIQEGGPIPYVPPPDWVPTLRIWGELDIYV
jgi:hypothetical protein